MNGWTRKSQVCISREHDSYSDHGLRLLSRSASGFAGNLRRLRANACCRRPSRSSNGADTGNSYYPQHYSRCQSPAGSQLQSPNTFVVLAMDEFDPQIRSLAILRGALECYVKPMSAKAVQLLILHVRLGLWLYLDGEMVCGARSPDRSDR